MPTKIQATLFEDAEAWLAENLPDMATDNVASVFPAQRITKEMLSQPGNRNLIVEFIDDNDTDDQSEWTRKKLSKQDLVRGLQLLCDGIGTKFHFPSLSPDGFTAMDLKDPGNWDAEIVDAYYQLCFHGEVIYG